MEYVIKPENFIITDDRDELERNKLTIIKLRTEEEFKRQIHIIEDDKEQKEPLKLKIEKYLKCENSSSNSKELMEAMIRETVTKELDKAKEDLIQNLIKLILNEKNSRLSCSVCEKAISGAHYSCKKCQGYILCECCEDNIRHPHDLLKRRNFE